MTDDRKTPYYGVIALLAVIPLAGCLGGYSFEVDNRSRSSIQAAIMRDSLDCVSPTIWVPPEDDCSYGEDYCTVDVGIDDTNKCSITPPNDPSRWTVEVAYANGGYELTSGYYEDLFEQRIVVTDYGPEFR